MDPNPNSSGLHGADPARPAPVAAAMFRSSEAAATVRFSPKSWAVAALVAAVLIAGLVFVLARHGRAHGAESNDAYAPNLAFSNLQMSESTSLSGGKSTFIDGVVRNNGSSTVTAVQLEVAFANDEAMPSERESVSLTPIRSREPYIDTEPLLAAPLAPGTRREFRLIFENISPNWNQSLPQLAVEHVSTACNPCR